MQDMTHITLRTGKSWVWPLIGALLVLAGAIMIVDSFANKEGEGLVQPVVLLLIGGAILLYLFMTQGKATVNMDFSKNMPIESWMFASGWPKWLRLSAIWGSEGGARTAYTSRSIMLTVKDAEAATAMLATRAYE